MEMIPLAGIISEPRRKLIQYELRVGSLTWFRSPSPTVMFYLTTCLEDDVFGIQIRRIEEALEQSSFPSG